MSSFPHWTSYFCGAAISASYFYFHDRQVAAGLFWVAVAFAFMIADIIAAKKQS